MVIGAGPAGASAAYNLLRIKPQLHVLLLERMDEEKFPKYHRMCGEGISKQGMDLLRFDYSDFIIDHIGRAREIWPGDIVLETKVKGFIIDRTRLLNELRRRFVSMGGEVRTDQMTDLKASGGGLDISCVNEDVRSHFVIAADGAHSRVRKNWFHAADPEMIWAEQYVIDDPMERDVIEFTYDERFKGGYAWRFPHGNRSQIGFPRGMGKIPEDALEVHRRAIPVGITVPLVKGNVCLVGDAGGLVNPVTFGGIRLAFASGRRAAQAIAKGDLASYDRKWRSSAYADGIYMEGYRQIKDMDNAQLRASMEPFRKGFGAISYVKAAASRPEFRRLYRSYSKSMRFGW